MGQQPTASTAAVGQQTIVIASTAAVERQSTAIPSTAVVGQQPIELQQQQWDSNQFNIIYSSQRKCSKVDFCIRCCFMVV